ncbi:hypothetical protein [Amycolatopsis sp. WGS_07]|uniref:hypothetical protein n=1 Tax=Amycolatopsis sp. WGS_07 TaxID=3076764 RepID=UPI0038738C5B
MESRRIDDRPDAGGWRSADKKVPTFRVESAGAWGACDIAHSILLDGDDFTRTVITVTGDGPEGWTTHTRTTWAPGWDEQRVMDVTVWASFHWYRAESDITWQVDAEDEADKFTAFLMDGSVLAAVAKTPRGRWKIVASDHWAHWAPSTHDKRFDDPKQAAAFVALRMGTALVEGEPGDDTDS